MLYTAAYLFLFSLVERTGIRTSQITAHTSDYGNLLGVMASAVRTYETFRGTLKFALVTTAVAFVNRGIGTVVRNFVIAVIPHILERLDTVLHVRILAVEDKTAA